MTMPKPCVWLILPLVAFYVSKSTQCVAFVIPYGTTTTATSASGTSETRFASYVSTTCSLASTPGAEDEDNAADPEGADLAAKFFEMARAKGISISADDLMDDDDEDDDLDDDDDGDNDDLDDEDFDEDGDLNFEYGDDEDDEELDDDEAPNIPQGAINAFLGYDTGDVGDKLAGNVTLTDKQLYREVKERVLDTAGGFVQLVGKAEEDDDDEDDDDDGDDEDGDIVKSGGDEEKPKEYEPPTIVPDPELTAGEVVLLILECLRNNDKPTKNKGVEVLFGYSSSASLIRNEIDLTPDEYAEFLQEAEYMVLFTHEDAIIDKGDYAPNGQKAFFTARLRVGPGSRDLVACNFQLSTEKFGDDNCWMVDSMLIRPSSMRRRRRR